MVAMNNRQGRHPAQGYLPAILVCAGAVAAQYGLQPFLGERFPLAVFPAAVIGAAWYGGFGPGLLATVLTAFSADYFFLQPIHSFRVDNSADAIALALFLLAGLLVSVAARHFQGEARSERRARREAERLLRQTAHLQELTAAMSRARTPADVMHACLPELLHAVDAAAGAVALVNEDRTLCEIAHAVGYGDRLTPQPYTIPLTSRTLITEAIRLREPLVPESLAASFSLSGFSIDGFLASYKAAVVVPLVAAGRAFGAVALSLDRPSVVDDERQFLLAAARHTAQALDRARLFEITERARADAEELRGRADLELRERQKAEQALRESETRYRALAARTRRQHALSAGLSEAVTVDAVAKVIVRQGRMVVGAAAGEVVQIVDGGQLEMLCNEEYERTPLIPHDRFSAERGLCVTAVAESGQPIFAGSFEELQKDYPRSASIAADGGHISTAALPLLVEGTAIGVLSFGFTAPVNFDDDYRSLLLSVAQHCAQALDRARLYEAAQRARSEAEAANRSKDDFLSTVSHELRTPLNAILGWAAMLRKGSLDPGRRDRAIEAIISNATRQAHLIDDLLDVSRIVSGRSPLDLQEVDIGETLRGAIEAIMPVAEDKRIEVKLDSLPGIHVKADPRRLEQVFLNLLSNAVKFTSPGGGVTVNMAIDERAVHVRVIDTGSGIEPAFLPYIFDQFRQADTTLARNVGGLGLGLFIARRLVEAHGGTIAADSGGQGCGTTFTVTLPLSARWRTLARALPDVPRPVPIEPDDAPQPVLEGLRVLLVDDEPDAREMMAAALETCGATVVTAASASDALTALEDRDVDVLLADIAMPGKDGYELIREIRGLASHRIATIPAAAVTACAREDERLRALAAGFQMHVAKPVALSTLAQTVAGLARRSSAP